MTPGTYTWPNVRKGNQSWRNKLEFQIYINSSPVDLTRASVKVSFKLRNGVYKFSLTSEAGDIQIEEPPTDGKFAVVPFVVTCPAGVYDYECDVTFANGGPYTFIEGTMTVIDKSSND